jgi:acyl-CoA synthetase (AMP-forming)/AMP-acid ligase II
MDAVEQLAADAGPRAVTTRALSQRTAISNGAIYHAFGSRGGLLGQVWLRAARRFLSEQRSAVARALADGVTPETAVEAVVAAAQCPATFLDSHPATAMYLLALPRNELLGARDVSDELADELITFTKDSIAAYKAPRSVDFVDELPRTPTGKLVKGELRKKYWPAG